MSNLAKQLAKVYWVRDVWSVEVQNALDQFAQSFGAAQTWKKKPSVKRIRKIYFPDDEEAYLEKYASAVIIRERIKRLYFGKEDSCDKGSIRTLITSEDRKEAKAHFQTLTKMSKIPALNLFSGCNDILKKLAEDYEALAKGKLPPKMKTNMSSKSLSSLIPPVRYRVKKTLQLYHYLKSCLKNDASIKTYADKPTETLALLDKLASSIDGLSSPRQIKKMILDRS